MPTQLTLNFTPIQQPSGELAHHHELDNNYDQRLYDARWLAYFPLSLESNSIHHQNRSRAKFSEVSLRLRAQMQNNIVRLGLLEDF